MNILRKPFLPLIKSARSFYTRGIEPDIVKTIEKYTHEYDMRSTEYIAHFVFWVVVPLSTGYMWYLEYQEKFVHRHRIPFPRYQWLHAQDKPYPFGDGRRTPMFHPYYNFTKHGYITDKDGNLLPPGVYAYE